MVFKGIRQATAIPRDALLVKVNPIFWHVRKILEEVHVILASDDVHKKVFPDVPMIGFKIYKSFKVHLVTSQSPDLYEVDRSIPCGGKKPPRHLCENMNKTYTFKSKHLDEVHKMNKKYNCNSKMTVYFIESLVSNILAIQKQLQI